MIEVLYLFLRLDLRKRAKMSNDLIRVQYERQLAHAEGSTGGALTKVMLWGFDRLKLDAR